MDAIRYLVKEGIQWRAMPCDFPPFGTVYDVLDRWEKSGATQRVHDELRRQCRIAAGRKPEPTAAIIDSQSVKAAETVARPGRGYDAGKKINGRKRHIAVDTIGLLLTVLVTAAGVQDRDGAKPLLWNLRRAFRTVRQARADSGYAGKLVTWASTRLKLKLQIVRRTELHKFIVLPRRWVVERTFAWITRHAVQSAITSYPDVGITRIIRRPWLSRADAVLRGEGRSGAWWLGIIRRCCRVMIGGVLSVGG